ncbi:hypothetical protein [Vibrio sp. 10N.239.312.D08]|uniref:hypothetical protein n=1 Tax=Vibrio sp. 10N.239.312.D08 TaxID=3229978 RepID=UPI00354E4FEF
MKKVVIKINKGKVNADYTGFYGEECKQLETRVKPESVEVSHVENKPEIQMEVLADQQGMNNTETEHF